MNAELKSPRIEAIILGEELLERYIGMALFETCDSSGFRLKRDFGIRVLSQKVYDSFIRILLRLIPF